MGENLASELLKELKASAKRWFIAFCVMVVLEGCTIFGFMWYISLPADESTITQESDNSSENTVIGGDYNGSEADSENSAQSNEK